MTAIDDLGWMNGGSLAETGGPWRIGFKRKMETSDYHPFIEIGKELGIRFQGLFVLAEMDRLNILKNYPTATQAGRNWDNSENISPEQIKIMNFVRDNSAYLEFGLHGIGHEHWENGKRTRAEWYDMENDKPWDESDLHKHVEGYKEILSQYGLNKTNGHSFPESFVPCGWALYWNPEGEYSTTSVLQQYGIKFANTWFEKVEELNPPIKFGGGIDHGVLVLNRYNYGNDWYMVGTLPERPLKEFKTNVIETHWSNWLTTDDFLQESLNRKWIDFFKNIQASPTHYYAKNTEQFYSQWLYKKYTKVTRKKSGEIIIDNRKMPDEIYENSLLGLLTLKTKLEKDEHISYAEIDGKQIPSYYEDSGFGFLFIPKLEKKKYSVKIIIGKQIPENIVINNGTSNIYSIEKVNKNLIFELRTYGTQEIEIKTKNFKKISSLNKNIRVVKKRFDSESRSLFVTLSANDFQGETGKIKIYR